MYIASFLRIDKRLLQWQQCCYVVQVLFGEKVILHTIQTCTWLFILLQNVCNYAEPVAENTKPVSKASLSHSTADT
jgi:hypothetical protein